MSFNLAIMLRESALERPDKTAIIAGGTTISYAELDALSGRFAASLVAAGYPRGASIGVQLPNVPQFLIAYFGILKAGMTMVPLNPLLMAPEVSYHLQDSDAVGLVTWEGFAPEAAKGAAAVSGMTTPGMTTPGMTTYVVSAPGSDARPEGTASFLELLTAEDDGDICPTSADDTAVLLYTSGTTGRPKGAMLTHLPAVHELHGCRRPVRGARRRRHVGGPAAVPRLRPVQRAQHRHPVRRDAVAGPTVRPQGGVGRHRARPGDGLPRRTDHVLRPAGRGHRRPRSVQPADRGLRRRRHPR